MVQFNLDVPQAQYIGTEKEARKLLHRLMKKVIEEPEEFIGLDSETHAKKIPLKTKKEGGVSKNNPLDWMQDTVTFWSMSAKLDGQYERWCLPVQLLWVFLPILENKRARFITWNGKYDAHVFHNSGAYVFGSTYFDGLAMASLVDENLQGELGLKEVAPKEHPFFHPMKKLDRNTYWGDLLKQGLIHEWVPIPMTKFTDLFPKKDPTGKKIVEYEYSIIDLFKHYPDRVSDYASLDAYATLRLGEHLREIMKVIVIDEETGYSTWDYFLEMELAITEILWRMEQRGLGINVEYLRSLIKPMSGELIEIEKQIWGHARWPVNLSSTQELRQLFFGNNEGTIKRKKDSAPAPGLWLAPLKMTKGGKTKLPSASTDQDVLDEIAGSTPEKLVEDMVEYHKLDPEELSDDDTDILTENAKCGISIAKSLKRHRTVQKIKSTYVEALIKLCEHHKDGRIHPEFKQFGARTGRFATKTPNCFDRTTEVLTKKGWVQLSQYDKRTEVAQWHLDSTVDFVVPTEYFRQKYTGSMVRVQNQHIDLFMTPNHRCPLRDRKTGAITVYSADGYKSDKQQIHGGYFSGGDSSITEDELTLLIAVHADGSWHDGGIDFAFKKNRKANRLKEVLDRLGVRYSYNPNQRGRHRFRVLAAPIVQDIKKLLGVDKTYGNWLLDLNRECLDHFCEEVFFWDGYWKGQTMFASKNESDAVWVQTVLALSGYKAKVRQYFPSNPRAKVSYQVDSTPRDYSLTTNVEKSEVAWEDDEVFCVTVPSGFILVKRGGKVCVSGNSQNFPRPDTDEFHIRSAFVAAIDEDLIVIDYEQLEMRIMAHFSQDEGMLSAIRSGLDLHCATVEKMHGIPYEEAKAAKKAGHISEEIDKGTGKPKNSLSKHINDLVVLGKKCECQTARMAERVLKGEDPADLIARISNLVLKRQQCKTVGFGIIYGAGGKTIGLQLEISEEEAEKLIEAYFEAFPGVRQYMEYTVQQCQDDEFVTTLVGRRRRLPDVNHHQFIKRSHAEREATNGPIQGSAADIVKAFMINVESDTECQEAGVRIYNQIHDELVIGCRKGCSERMLPIIKRHGELPFNGQPALCVDTPCDGKIVTSWDKAK